jgi:Na+-transporting methylmalonyl-CoA/oxaloacetate decarboxylase gamma subunit
MKPNMFDNLPSVLLALFLALCVLWLIGQVLRRLLSSRKRRQEPSLEAQPEARMRLNELAEPQAAATISTIPDAADVLALKAAIDNLARQVAALERRLASGQTDPSSIQAALNERRTIEPTREIPSVTPDHRI